MQRGVYSQGMPTAEALFVNPQPFAAAYSFGCVVLCENYYHVHLLLIHFLSQIEFLDTALASRTRQMSGARVALNNQRLDRRQTAGESFGLKN